jgi:hypothetical protein
VTDGLSLLWNPTSYCGKMFISLTSAPNIVPDPGFLADCLRESYEELKAAAAKVAAVAAAEAANAPRKKRRAKAPVAKVSKRASAPRRGAARTAAG